MPAYVCVTIDIRDQQAYERYKLEAPPSIGLYGGKYLTRGGAIEVLEGEWPARRFVILEFPDMAAAKRWHDSPEYAPARAQRCACASTVMLLADGLPEPWTPKWPRETGGAA
jgi:uncharacterized protein (DUF1330 family)